MRIGKTYDLCKLTSSKHITNIIKSNFIFYVKKEWEGTTQIFLVKSTNKKYWLHI